MSKFPKNQVIKSEARIIFSEKQNSTFFGGSAHTFARFNSPPRRRWLRRRLFPSLLAGTFLTNFAFSRLSGNVSFDRFGIPDGVFLRRRKRPNRLERSIRDGETAAGSRERRAESSGKPRWLSREEKAASGIGRVTNGRFTASIIHRHKI